MARKKKKEKKPFIDPNLEEMLVTQLQYDMEESSGLDPNDPNNESRQAFLQKRIDLYFKKLVEIKQAETEANFTEEESERAKSNDCWAKIIGIAGVVVPAAVTVGGTAVGLHLEQHDQIIVSPTTRESHRKMLGHQNSYKPNTFNFGVVRKIIQPKIGKN